jgi:hypothetical protein
VRDNPGVLATTAELVIGLTLATALFAAWVVALALLVADSISTGSKIVWFVLLTLLAPVSIPVYLFLRHRRVAAGVASSPG